MSEVLDPAIPELLKQERTQPVSTPSSDYVPPYPSYCARFPTDAKDLVMAIIGTQCAPENIETGNSAVSKVVKLVSADTKMKPLYWELASCTDKIGAYHVAVIAYWPSKSSFMEWEEASGFRSWWNGLESVTDDKNGWFIEVLFPSIERFETLFTDKDVPEGAAHMRETVTCPVKEHGYWGSMRDRLPISQTDALKGEEWTKTPDKAAPKWPTSRHRVLVQGKQNLAIIRSGQDWSNTAPKERKLYLDTMQPVLTAGMNFLRDEGSEIGCYSCRLMEVLDPVTHKTDKDKTFGLAYFDSLGSLEKWSKQHKTHLAIFGGFMKYAKELGPEMSFRAWHEVMVVASDQQRFEYIGCHDDTGMLVSLFNSS